MSESDFKPTPDIQPFEWNLICGADQWTDDPAVIAGLSDTPIIEGLLRNREVGSIIGAAKSLKTWISLFLALCVAAGQLFLGRATHKCKVLYLDYELKPGTFRKRMSMLAKTQPEDFFYVCLRGEERLPSVDEIATLVEAKGFGLVVIDSLYQTGWLSEENSNDSTPRELKVLQRFTKRVACSVLLVDHTAKGGGKEKSNVDAGRGASSKAGFYDAIYVLRPTEKGPDPAGNYVIFDHDVRDWAKTTLPLISFVWTATSCTVDVAGEVERVAVDTNAAKILEAVASAEGSIGCRAISEACGLGEGTVRPILDALASKGRLIRDPDPKHKQRFLYRMPDLADEPRKTPKNHAA